MRRYKLGCFLINIGIPLSYILIGMPLVIIGLILKGDK
jgi:hypothetical protein